MTHQIRFSLEGLHGIRWENSKRLIFGSLVCFSSDNFKSLLFATIANREPKSLRDGRIDVFFHNASPGLMNQTYTMVESSTYFEVKNKHRMIAKSCPEHITLMSRFQVVELFLLKDVTLTTTVTTVTITTITL